MNLCSSGSEPATLGDACETRAAVDPHPSSLVVVGAGDVCEMGAEHFQVEARELFQPPSSPISYCFSHLPEAGQLSRRRRLMELWRRWLITTTDA